MLNIDNQTSRIGEDQLIAKESFDTESYLLSDEQHATSLTNVYSPQLNKA